MRHPSLFSAYLTVIIVLFSAKTALIELHRCRFDWGRALAYPPSLITRAGSWRHHVTAIVCACPVAAAVLCILCEGEDIHLHLRRPVWEIFAKHRTQKICRPTMYQCTEVDVPKWYTCSDQLMYRSRTTLCTEVVINMYRSSLYRSIYRSGPSYVPKWSCTELALTLHQILTDFKNSFSGTLSSKICMVNLIIW